MKPCISYQAAVEDGKYLPKLLASPVRIMRYGTMQKGDLAGVTATPLGYEAPPAPWAGHIIIVERLEEAK